MPVLEPHEIRKEIGHLLDHHCGRCYHAPWRSMCIESVCPTYCRLRELGDMLPNERPDSYVGTLLRKRSLTASEIIDLLTLGVKPERVARAAGLSVNDLERFRSHSRYIFLQIVKNPEE